MVRRIVGVLAKIGTGEITPEDFRFLLEGNPSRKFDVAAWTAPAAGLFLEKVEYSKRHGRANST
jgi:tRNA U38,U39,U40 pseudouridine synthase TruA